MANNMIRQFTRLPAFAQAQKCLHIVSAEENVIITQVKT